MGLAKQIRTQDPPEFIPTRSSLLSRLKDWDDEQSWRDFFDTYWKLIYNTATKAGLSEAEAQDVVQDTVLSVAKKMHEFKYDAAQGSFKGWLLQLTRWRILNQLKKRLPAERMENGHRDEDPGTSLAERVPDPTHADMEEFWEKEWQKNLIGAAIENVKQNVNPRHYEMFHLLVVKKLPAAKVAASLNVLRAQVYLAKHRVTALVKKEVRRLEKKMI
jgi:RNA polymerase sigma factor (sigma-70 family)